MRIQMQPTKINKDPDPTHWVPVPYTISHLYPCHDFDCLTIFSFFYVLSLPKAALKLESEQEAHLSLCRGVFEPTHV
jgi:hypothetical protein